MPRRVFIAYPRLDCSFSGGHVPDEEGPLSPLRERWRDFLDGLIRYHRERGDDLEVEKRPLWLFDLPYMREIASGRDIVYIPHRQKQQFDVGPSGLYYKMSAFPEYFTVDALGWGAGLSYSPVQPLFTPRAEQIYAKLSREMAENISKFPQPPLSNTLDVDQYDLFVCQIPHDESIVYHSAIGVRDALKAVLDFCEARGRILVVKGHPANPRAMIPLRELVEVRACARWVDDVSIHRCLAAAQVVYLVNSGSGFEAILHGKPVVAFGRAEYSSVVTQATLDPESLGQAQDQPIDRERYVGVIGAFIDRCVHIRDQASYSRVEDALLVHQP